MALISKVKGNSSLAMRLLPSIRGFTNKATINLDSKLAKDEMVLIVDEEDNPVRQATRLEMVNYIISLIQYRYRGSRICGIEAQPYM